VSLVSSDVVVLGAGETRHGKVPEMSMLGFHLEAAALAVEDSGLQHDAVDGLLVVSPLGGGDKHGFAALLAAHLGLQPAVAVTVDAGGATACVLVQMARALIRDGQCRAVLCLMGTKSATERRPQSTRAPQEFTQPFGVYGAVAYHAHQARQHMDHYGLQVSDLGGVAVAMRRHASLKEGAQQRAPITLEDHAASRMVVDPLRLLDCCQISDGGAAVLVAARDLAADARQVPVTVAGAGQFSRADMFNSYVTGRGGAPATARRAFDEAGVAHGDIDVALLYDCFTITVLLQLEDYGFCEIGEGGVFARDGAVELGGRLPVNTHGGLLSDSHLMGMGHIVEAVRQLRGECGLRQVAGARTAFVSGYGGAVHETPPAVTWSSLVLTR
jgi:acetyl-CoA acetyltransferase